MQAEYKVQLGQSLFDVCLNTYGSLDFMYKLITDNGVNNILYQPVTGQVFTYDPALTVNPTISRTKSISDIRYSTYANVTIDAPFA